MKKPWRHYPFAIRKPFGEGVQEIQEVGEGAIGSSIV
jgi:hypothetical protein